MRRSFGAMLIFGVGIFGGCAGYGSTFPSAAELSEKLNQRFPLALQAMPDPKRPGNLLIHFFPDKTLNGITGRLIPMGGEYAQGATRRFSEARKRYLEGYGFYIEHVSFNPVESVVSIPTPSHLVQIHHERVERGLPTSYFEPVLVTKTMTSENYVEYLSRGQFPIDASGESLHGYPFALEFNVTLHDELNHWVNIASMSKKAADWIQQLAKTAEPLSFAKTFDQLTSTSPKDTEGESMYFMRSFNHEVNCESILEQNI